MSRRRTPARAPDRHVLKVQIADGVGKLTRFRDKESLVLHRRGLQRDPCRSALTRQRTQASAFARWIGACGFAWFTRSSGGYGAPPLAARAPVRWRTFACASRELISAGAPDNRCPCFDPSNDRVTPTP